MAGKGVLWGYPLSFAAQKALLGFEEKQVPYELKKIDILLGDNFNPEYIKINANATVPTYIEGDKTLTDSIDILKYLDTIGEPLGGDKVDRRKVEEWYQRQSAWDDSMYTYAVQGIKASSPISTFRQKVLEARKTENPGLAELYDSKLASMKKMLEECQKPEVYKALHMQLIDMLDVAEGQLSHTPFVAGETFSMADVVLMTVLNRVEMLNKTKELVAPKPHLSKYWQEAKMRDSYKKVMAPVAGARALPTLVGLMVSLTFRSLFKRY